MNKLIIIFIILLFSISTINAQFFKQSDIDIYKKDVAGQAKSLVKEHLDLTKDQAKIFWPLYDEYHTKSDVILNEELLFLEDYLMHYYILDDAKAKELVGKSFTLKRNKLDLQEEYFEKMSKVLPAKVAGKFLQIDNRLNAMINQQRSEKMPLVRDQDKN